MKVKVGDTINLMLPVTDETAPAYLGPFEVRDIFEDGSIKIVALGEKP